MSLRHTNVTFHTPSSPKGLDSILSPVICKNWKFWELPNNRSNISSFSDCLWVRSDQRPVKSDQNKGFPFWGHQSAHSLRDFQKCTDSYCCKRKILRQQMPSWHSSACTWPWANWLLIEAFCDSPDQNQLQRLRICSPKMPSPLSSGWFWPLSGKENEKMTIFCSSSSNDNMRRARCEPRKPGKERAKAWVQVWPTLWRGMNENGNFSYRQRIEWKRSDILSNFSK